jgi:hypothetical protein
MINNEKWLRGALVAIVIIHFIVALWHGIAHLHIPVPLTATQTVFIGIVILLLPLIGAGLLWTKLKRVAVWLITLSMLASLLFGLFSHYVLNSPDYMMEIPAHAWRYSFVLSAALLVATETIGTVIGGIGLLMWRDSLDGTLDTPHMAE